MARTQKKTSNSARTRARKPVHAVAAATHEVTFSPSARTTLLAGVAVIAAGAAATGAVVMRRRIGKLATGAASEAVLAGHSVGSFGHRIGKSLGREITELDLTRLLAYAGIRRRPSLLRRLIAPAGVLAALVAAGGSALFLLAPKLREVAGDDAPLRENKIATASIAKPIAVPEPTPIRNSIGSSIGSSIDDIEQGVSHAVK